MRYLWRAVDYEGEMLESFVTNDWNKSAAPKFTKKVLKRHGSPKAITTNGLRSYGAAMRELGNTDKREVGLWPTTGWRTAIRRSDHKNAPCCGF